MEMSCHIRVLATSHQRKKSEMRLDGVNSRSVMRRTVHDLIRNKSNQSHYRPGQAQRVLRKLRLPDFVTAAQDGGRLSALCTGHFYPQEILLVLISVRG